MSKEGLDVQTAKRMLEDAVESLGPECHEAYAGACREDRNAAVCAIQDGQGADTVARQYFGQGAREVVIETTHTVHGCLEQGGVCGRRVAYPADVIRGIMGAGCDMDTVDGGDMVPGCAGVTLRQYLEHHGYEGRVIDAGTVIQ